jgi:hypothetical protein
MVFKGGGNGLLGKNALIIEGGRSINISSNFTD